MAMNPTSPVALYLSTIPIPHRVFQHAGPVHSLAQAAQERGQQPAQVERSILFRLAEGDYAMVLMAGPGQIDWRALRRFFGQSRLTMASEEEVLSVTGYPIGALCVCWSMKVSLPKKKSPSAPASVAQR